MNLRKLMIVFGLFFITAGFAAAEGVGEAVPPVTATTSWTAAFVRAAGYGGEIHVLAPYELRHPPEYELKPSDIAAVSNAEIIVFAGYERMVGRLKEAAASEARMVRITTNYSLGVIEETLTNLGSVLGTAKEAERSVREFSEFYGDWRDEIDAAGAGEAEVICHFFQRPLAEQLGFTVIAVFGPAPIEASELNKLAGLQPDFIIDNWHNDVGKPLREVMPDADAVEFINFPGHEGTESLMDVLKYNRQKLREVLE